ncbi:MAG: aminotransferase class V-fold PLP-dependent enzyme [Gemmatimonadetes bacterium]|nr:aminotransferase class V-fold PLP-dependent enzyme [Gemmatimonadota bacterium]
MLGATALTARGSGIEAIVEAAQSVADRTPKEVAQDEFFWREIQFSFTLDRTLTNLNNGNSSPTPRVVHEALKRYLDFSNQLPVFYRGQLAGHIETVRRRLADEFGCDTEELAITRNASEALQIAQNGLDLQPGDEVLTTDQDYGRMRTTWDQRVRREGITLTQIRFPVPTTQDDLYERFERAITPRTKVLHFCHITNLTGQLFPVQRLSRLARARGLVSICDGAHAVAHFPFKLRDLECDYYGTSLHKWLLAPHGTGFLYVRRENIEKTWPLQAARQRQDNDIRKFEEIGTHSAGPKAAIAEALAFHQAIGVERKAARFRYLTMRWADRLKDHPRIKIHSSLEPGQTWALANVQIEGVDTREINSYMWDRFRIVLVPIVRDDYEGLRVTPNVYTRLQEIDQFADAMLEIADNGNIPTL